MTARKRVHSILDLNVNRLVRMTTTANIVNASRYYYHEINTDGKISVVPALGSIVLDFDIGDLCDKFESDHLQPCATVGVNPNGNPENDENMGLFTYACIGNEVTIIDEHSPCHGAKGTVIGKHGGVNYIMVRFYQDLLKKMNGDERVKVEMYGMGLKDIDHDNISFMNIDPDLLLTIPVKKDKTALSFPVRKIIPAKAMGSGMGETRNSGDYDIMKPFSEGLRIGDFVAIQDHYCKVGPCYSDGSVTVGVIVHGECADPGHGPGVLPIMTARGRESLTTHFSSSANLRTYL